MSEKMKIRTRKRSIEHDEWELIKVLRRAQDHSACAYALSVTQKEHSPPEQAVLFRGHAEIANDHAHTALTLLECYLCPLDLKAVVQEKYNLTTPRKRRLYQTDDDAEPIDL